MLNRIRSLLAVVVWLACAVAHAQGPDLNAVLSSVVRDERYQYSRELNNFAGGLKYHVPLVRKIEGRFGINGNANGDTLYGNIRNEDIYGVQVTTNSLREIRRQKQYKTARQGVLEADVRQYLQQALLDRYQALVYMRYAGILTEQRNVLVGLLDKKHAIIRDMLDKGVDIKIKDVMDAENDKNTLQLMLIDLENTRRLHQGRLQQFMRTEEAVVPDFSGFISVEGIAGVAERMRALPSDNPVIAYRRAQIGLADAGYELEWVQNRQVLSFLQVAYENPVLQLETPKKPKTVNNFSFRFGLTVPLPGNNNFKRSEAALQAQDARNDYELNAVLNQKAVDMQFLKLDNLMRQYQLCRERIGQSLIRRMLSNEKLMLQVTPLEIVDLQITQQKLEIRSYEIAQDITNEYLRLLDLNGALSAAPLRNYLMEALPGF